MKIRKGTINSSSTGRVCQASAAVYTKQRRHFRRWMWRHALYARWPWIIPCINAWTRRICWWMFCHIFTILIPVLANIFLSLANKKSSWLPRTFDLFRVVGQQTVAWAANRTCSSSKSAPLSSPAVMWWIIHRGEMFFFRNSETAFVSRWLASVRIANGSVGAIAQQNYKIKYSCVLRLHVGDWMH